MARSHLVFGGSSGLALTMLALLPLACGGSSDGAPQQPAASADQDAGVYIPPQPDAAAPPDDPIDPNYPSAHAAPETVDYHGGRVIKNVKVVSITWTGDALQDRIQQFGDTITATPYWSVLGEYCDKATPTPNCVGPGTSGGHVVLTDAPASSYIDSSRGGSASMQDFVKSKIADGTFPAPDADTLYAIYLPESTTVTLDGEKSCQGFGAYHNTTKLVPPGSADGQNVYVPYAIIPRCSTSEAELTVSASHELAEAATDPDIGINSLSFYNEDQVWAPAGGEVGDLCEFGGGNSAWTESTFAVQRLWSNKSALAGHNPCVPIPNGTVYFNAAPAAGKESLALTVGKSATIEIDAFSDAPYDDWTLSVVDGARYTGDVPSLDFQLDKTTVHNGSKAKLTITLTQAPTNGMATYYVTSRDSHGNRHNWPGVIYQK